MKNKVISIIILFLICYLPGTIGGLCCEKKPDSTSEETEYVGVYEIGELVLYDTPKRINFYSQGKCIFLKSGKHPAEIIEYYPGSGNYTIGIEMGSGFFFEVRSVPPEKLFKLQ